jgi:N-methylhydantoinase A/oxoprolinase/acetone carboxylase beta subunit
VLEAAWGVHKVVNESMANALKTCVAERGGDIHRITMVGFGGAGPVHAARLARTLKIPKVLIPPCAGVASALGFLLAPIAYDIVRTYKVPLERLNVSKLKKLVREMEAEASQVVAEAEQHRASVTRRFAELNFVGQGYPVMVALAESKDGAIEAEALRASFLEAYRKRYGHCSDTFPVELVSLRVTVSVEPEGLPAVWSVPEGSGGSSLKGKRNAFDETAGKLIAHEVHNRYLMAAGLAVKGPALIEERETTTVVPAGAVVTVHEDGALLISFAK